MYKLIAWLGLFCIMYGCNPTLFHLPPSSTPSNMGERARLIFSDGYGKGMISGNIRLNDHFFLSGNVGERGGAGIGGGYVLYSTINDSVKYSGLQFVLGVSGNIFNYRSSDIMLRGNEFVMFPCFTYRSRIFDFWVGASLLGAKIKNANTLLTGNTVFTGLALGYKRIKIFVSPYFAVQHNYSVEIENKNVYLWPVYINLGISITY